jgi:hypothetical protein
MNTRVNFNHRFTDENGKAISFGRKPFSKFKDLAVACLLHAASGEGEPGAQEKVHRFQLAAKIRRSGQEHVELKPEDRALLMQCLGKAYHTLIVGVADQLLQGKKPEEFPRDEEDETEREAPKLAKVAGEPQGETQGT